MQLLLAQGAALVGLLISVYATYVEHRVRKEPSYKAICDWSDRFSCTKAFTSKYGRIFGISNSVVGVTAYFTFLTMSFSIPRLLPLLAVVAIVGSAALAFISYVKMRTYCVVCTTIYVVNLVLLYATLT
jgi:vitamin-K-epoxide reductase (warfarin-sensitive)